MLCATPKAARALHNLRATASRTSLTCPIPFLPLQRKSSSSSDIPLYDGKPYPPLPPGKKEGRLTPPLDDYAYCIISRRE